MNSKIKNASLSFLFYIIASVIFVLKGYNQLHGNDANLYYFGVFAFLALAIFFMIKFIVILFK